MTTSNSLLELGRTKELIWDDISVGEQKATNPTWQEIEAAINSLSLPIRTMVVLENRDGCTLTVAGDVEHGFLVFVTVNDQFFYVLANPEKRSGQTEMTIGYQPGFYANKILTDAGTALKVARTFFLSGSKEEEVDWTIDDSPCA